MLLYQSIVTFALTLLLINTVLNLRLLRGPPRTDSPLGEPLVSILVPARNESHTIARCLTSLALQDYKHCEILVLDDQSEDETATVVERLARQHPQIRSLHGRLLPAGWHGKAFACAQLAAAAQGEWLLFVDADTIHAPNSVCAALLLAQERRADLVTLMPRLEAGSWGEALLLPTIPLTFLAFLPLRLVTWRRAPFVTGALGQFLLFRRDAYQKIGGHKAVRRDIVEDMQLSRLVKWQGGRVVWMDGSSLMRVRMYHGLGAAWQGFTKSAFAAINYSVPALIPSLLACGVLLLGPYVWLADGLIMHQMASEAFRLSMLQISLLWSSYLLVLRRVYLPQRLVLLHAVTILAILVFTVHSAYQTTRGAGVLWKGRRYRFDRLPTRMAEGHPSPLGWELPIVRMLFAIVLVLGGWLGGGTVLPFLALAVLGAWTCAAIEHASPIAYQPTRSSVANATLGLSGVIALQRFGLSSLGLILFAAVVVLLGVRFGSPHAGVLLGSAMLSGMLVLAAAASARLPALSVVLIGWTAGLALLIGRRMVDSVLLRLERTRSS